MKGVQYFLLLGFSQNQTQANLIVNGILDSHLNAYENKTNYSHIEKKMLLSD